jgi:hypothetical protein
MYSTGNLSSEAVVCIEGSTVEGQAEQQGPKLMCLSTGSTLLESLNFLVFSGEFCLPQFDPEFWSDTKSAKADWWKGNTLVAECKQAPTGYNTCSDDVIGDRKSWLVPGSYPTPPIGKTRNLSSMRPIRYGQQVPQVVRKPIFFRLRSFSLIIPVRQSSRRRSSSYPGQAIRPSGLWSMLSSNPLVTVENAFPQKLLKDIEVARNPHTCR